MNKLDAHVHVVCLFVVVFFLFFFFVKSLIV